MEFAKTFRVVGFALAALLLSSSAHATPVAFTFTGAGVNGSSAVGSFTVDSGALTPGYFATGGIYSSGIALTITGIPGGGPATASFDDIDIASSWFYVDAGGVPYIAPYGSHNFGPPFQNHYDLGQPSQPGWPASAIYETVLGYNLLVKDTITWSAAIPVSVPEPGTAALILPAIVVGAFVLRRRILRIAA